MSTNFTFFCSPLRNTMNHQYISVDQTLEAEVARFQIRTYGGVMWCGEKGTRKKKREKEK